MLSTNWHERQSVHPWYMRRHPLVSASLRKRRFFCLSLSLERERRNPAAWTMQQSAVTTTPAAAYPLRPIRYGTLLPLYLPSTTRPTDQPTTNGLEMSKRKSARSDHHHPHSHHPESQCKIPQLHQYLPDISPSDTRPTYLTYSTSPHLPFFGSHPKRKHSSLIHPSIHPRRPVPSSSAHDIQVK